MTQTERRSLGNVSVASGHDASDQTVLKQGSSRSQIDERRAESEKRESRMGGACLCQITTVGAHEWTNTPGMIGK